MTSHAGRFGWGGVGWCGQMGGSSYVAACTVANDDVAVHVEHELGRINHPELVGCLDAPERGRENTRSCN